MPTVAWNKLNSPNPIVAYQILAEEISDKFFNGNLIAVPSIDQASDYDLMVCFYQMSSNYLHPTKFKLIGHFFNITAPVEDEMLIEALGNPHKEDITPKAYSYTWTDVNNDKSVTIIMSGMSKYQVSWHLKQGSLVLDCEKIDLRNESLYVISEVVYAGRVVIDVRVDKNSEIDRKIMEIDTMTGQAMLDLGTTVLQDDTVIDAGIPVAFSYLKFHVDNNGALVADHDKIQLNAVFEY